MIRMQVEKPAAIPCRGQTTIDGDHDCGYEHAPECERCVCAGGTINPKTGRAATLTQRLASLMEILAKRDDQLRKAEEDLHQVKADLAFEKEKCRTLEPLVRLGRPLRHRLARQD